MLLFFLFFQALFQISAGNAESLHVLIISGQNNHNWEQTTQQLETIFSENELFSFEVTLKPDTLKSDDFKHVDVVLSNWNSWPENELRWPEKTENALIEYIKNGGGFVTFHAASSAFYNWPTFKKISTGAWIMNKTSHGKNSTTEVLITNREHPITQRMTGFFIFDELWIDAEENLDFKVLGTAINKKLQQEGKASQPAIMVGNYGKGRIFHTILGHDARAMRNAGFRLLLQRGTEWAATGNVTQPVVQELQPVNNSKIYNWKETDTTLVLFNGEQIIWQYNYNTKYGRPYFHPVFAGRNNITCLSPDDHVWHLGQWFCWKYINKVNYWEYGRGPFQSDGVTTIKNISFKKNDDYSAEIIVELVYHPYQGENVLAEKRIVTVSSPQSDGKLWMDYDFTFEILADVVELNRTPVLGQENGKSWGGYAGLSIRFSQDFSNSHFIAPWNNNDSINRQTGDWLYMGFNGIDGTQAGSQIMVPPSSRRGGWAWYSVNSGLEPFYYISPAYLYFKPLTLKKNERFSLKYRILHLPGKVDKRELNETYRKYINQ